MVVENILTPRGFKITTCMSGVEALELLESRSYLPDLILLDCMMPVMSGFEVCQTLRRKHPQNALPIIMVSARSGDEDIVRGLSLGCNDYITKPFSAGELNARIDVQLKIRELWRNEIQKLGGWQARSERLPKNVKMRLKKGSSMIMDYHENVSVLICELVNMRRYAQGMEMDTFVHFLNHLYGTLDDVASKHGVLPILGDTYMVVTGHEARLGPSLAAGQNPADNADHHVDSSISSSRRLIKVAMDFLKVADEMSYNLQGKAVRPRLRIGISTGEAYSGFVGSRNAHFTFFGTAIYEAWDMTSLGFHGCIHISQSTYDDLESRDDTVLFTDAPGRKSYLMKVGEFEHVLELKKAEAQGTSVQDFPERLREDVEGQLSKPRVAAHQAYLNMIRTLHVDDKSCPNCKGSLAMVCTKCRLGDDFSLLSESSERDMKFHFDKFGKYEILSVDDDQVNQMVIENILRPSGYEVKVCMDVPEALAELGNRDYLPDLCLVDVMMPSMDGYEVVRKLRTLYPDTLPIVMVSANLDIASDAQACGADAWDSKPLKAGAIVEKIQKTMEMKKSSRRSSPDGRAEGSLRRSNSREKLQPSDNSLQESNKMMEEINNLRAELTVMQDKADKLEEEKKKLQADLDLHVLSNKQKEQEVSELKQARRDAEVRHMKEMKDSENVQKARVRKDLEEKNKMVLNADSRSHDSKLDLLDNITNVVTTCIRCTETEKKLEDACGREREIMQLLVTVQTQHSQLQIAYCTLVNKCVGHSLPTASSKARTSTLELVELLEENDLWMDYDVLKGMGVRKVEDLLHITGSHLDSMAPVTANKVRRLQALLEHKEASQVVTWTADQRTPHPLPTPDVAANRSSLLPSELFSLQDRQTGNAAPHSSRPKSASKTEMAVEAIGRALKVLGQSDSNGENISDDVRSRLISMLLTPKP
uniref:Guanylate cyclase n=1 Tax=Guillardia theta TaxID=55529 RepID=A0A6U5W8X1_GUITH|mmetsp:Transcript_12693/g.44428  ORF Transcript_12693/g.44428 Transcript_12693/m.44428 type:complete len:931 (+) Transcript_12693:399-3191(+)